MAAVHAKLRARALSREHWGLLFGSGETGGEEPGRKPQLYPGAFPYPGAKLQISPVPTLLSPVPDLWLHWLPSPQKPSLPKVEPPAFRPLCLPISSPEIPSPPPTSSQKFLTML